MEKLRTIAGLLRIRHTAQVAGIVALVGLKNRVDFGHLVSPVLAILSLTVSLFFLDDAHDYKSDVVVHPGRAVPRGVVASETLLFLGIPILVSAILVALTLSRFQLFCFATIAFSGLVVVYLRLPSVLRSMLAAYMIWALFPFGTGSMNAGTLLFGLVVALPHIGGNIAKDFIHQKGDQKIGLPRPHTKSKYIAASAFLTCSIVLWIPVALGLVNWYYTGFILLTFLSCLFLGAELLLNRFGKVYLLGAVGMIASLLAFIFGLDRL